MTMKLTAFISMQWLCLLVVLPSQFAIFLEKKGYLQWREFKKAFALVGISATIIGFESCRTLAAEEPNQVKVYGLKKGRLLPCTSKSNCISTSSINSVEKYSRPWEFSTSPTEEYRQIVSVIDSDPYLSIAEKDEANLYVRAEAKSAVPPTGIDDIELLINSKDKLITYRSNSRDVLMAGSQVIGDGGSNRNRLNSIKLKLKVEEMGLNDEAESYIRKGDQLTIFERMAAASQPNEINFLDNSVPAPEQ